MNPLLVKQPELHLDELGLSCFTYRHPSGALVLDFTMPAATTPATHKSIPRSTRSSRTPSGRNQGVVYSRNVQHKRCPDCGGACDGWTRPGQHAVIGRDGKWVNCIGAEVSL